MAGVKCTFLEFVQVWANIEGWEIPNLHKEIIEWLEDYENWKGRTGVLQIARNHGKSTLVGLFITWKLTQDPTFRFLIISEKKATATKMVNHIIGIIKRHPVAQCLYNKNNPTEMWRADSIKVIGFNDDRSASVESQGISSAITGARADFIIFDDVEGPKNTATAAKREKLRQQLKEPSHILTPKGYTLYIGTPHAQESIYPELIGEAEATTDEDISIRQVSSMKRPGMSNCTGEFPNIVGIPIWKERFDVKEYLQKQQATGKNAMSKGNFLSQYLLIPYRITKTQFNSEDMIWYDNEIIMSRDGRAWIGSTEIVGMKVFWDPSLGHSAGSAIAVTLQDDKGHNYFHWVARLKKYKVDPITGSDSMEPEEQCKFVINLAQQFHFNNVTIESNGIGGFMTRLFRREAAATGITCTERYTKGEKANRIAEIIEPRLQSHMLHIHTRHRGTTFQREFDDFNTSSQRDCDTIDAAASSIEIQPIRIKGGQAGNLNNPFGGGYREPIKFQDKRTNRSLD